MKIARLFVLFSILFTCSNSYAALYQWRYPSVESYPSGLRSSPADACKVYLQNVTISYPGGQVWRYSHVEVSGDGYSCFGMQDAGFPSHRYYSTREGDSCEALSIYNPQTGECEAPELNKCEVLEGAGSSFTSSSAFPSNSACVNGCAVTIFETHIISNTSGPYGFSMYGIYNGNECSGSNPPAYNECVDPEQCTPDEPDPVVENDNECTSAEETAPDGTVWKVDTCTKVDDVKKDANEKCTWGQVNGAWECVGKKPTSTKTETKTETKSKTNPDGSIDKTTTTTVTETKCTGVNSCVTTTTTTNINEGTKADGTPGNSDSICIGPKCPTGDLPEDEVEDEKPTVSGDGCGAELSCEGDVIQCAILRKSKEQSCQFQYDGDVQSQIDAAIGGEGSEISEESVGVGSLFNEAVSKGRWLPSSCPSPENFTVMGNSYSLSWQPVCRFAQAIAPIIVALASIFFALSIGRALKGS